jgi:hypothetical protein
MIPVITNALTSLSLHVGGLAHTFEQGLVALRQEVKPSTLIIPR